MNPRLIVAYPRNYPAERRYVLSLVLGEFLGLDLQLLAQDRGDTEITVGDDPRGKRLCVADGLFSTPAADWLKPASMPSEPLGFWQIIADLPELSGVLTHGSLPILYGAPNAPRLHLGSDHIRLGFDLFGSIFFMLTRYEEVVHPRQDIHGCYPAQDTLAFREGFLERPIVNEYLETLWTLLTRLWPGLRRKTHRYQAVVSHDVDVPTWFVQRSWPWPLRGRLGHVFRNPSTRSVLDALFSFSPAADPYFTFPFLMQTSEKAGLRSEFYFFGERTGVPLDGNYSLESPFMRSLLSEIHQRGHRIGLHPSYHSLNQPALVQQQFQALLKTTAGLGIQQESWGGRQHYLRWGNPVTWQAWQDAGLDYDSSLGFNEHTGFRCGLCYAFPVFNLLTRTPLQLYERPLIAMEVTLLVWWRLGLDQALQRIIGLSKVCHRFGGSFQLLWHNSSLVTDAHKHLYTEVIGSIA
jgi:hypothetical protein